nr:MAG TPA_asm: hypothetical protein [Caudoviricetes sp.]
MPFPPRNGCPRGKYKYLFHRAPRDFPRQAGVRIAMKLLHLSLFLNGTSQR